MFSVSFYIRRFAQRLLITEKEMKRESGGIFLNLIDLSVSCRFVVEKKEKRLLRCQLSLWNSFVFVFSRLFVLASYMLACIYVTR